MEFPASALTNVHILDGFSAIYYRVFVLVDDPPTEQASLPPSPTLSKSSVVSLSRLRAAEGALRNAGVLATLDRSKRELWVFSKDQDFSLLLDPGLAATRVDDASLRIGQCVLKVTASGNARALQMVNGGTPLPTSAKPSPATPSDSGGQIDQSHIYRLLMSSLLAVVGRLLLRNRRYLPLNARTYFRLDASKIDDSESFSDLDHSPLVVTIDLALLAVGKVIILFKPVVQPCLCWLPSMSAIEEVEDTQKEISSLWLAPSGRIARLVVETESQMPLASPSSEIRNSEMFDSEHSGMRPARLESWKTRVIDWLANLGMEVLELKEDRWIEVEIIERVSILEMLPTTPTIESPHFRRLFWPSSLCFSRKSKGAWEFPAKPPLEGQEGFDPIAFSETWFTSAEGRNSQIQKRETARHTGELQREQAKLFEQHPRHPEMTENLEMLARTTNYVDLQAASMVYPTPPDGTQSQPPVGSASVDGVAVTPADAADITSSQARQASHYAQEEASLEPPSAKAPTASDLQTSEPEVTVGSGMYDADGDEEMFGDISGEHLDGEGAMDEPNWDFFDDPDSEQAEAEEIKEPTQLQSEHPESEHADQLKDEPIHVDAEDSSKLTIGDASAIEDASEPPKLAHDSESAHEKAVDGAAAAVQHGHSPEHDAQTMSPPLSPDGLKKELTSNLSSIPGESASLGEKTISGGFQQRRPSHFNPVSFARTIGSYDEKYGAQGRFWFDTTDLSPFHEKQSTDLKGAGGKKQNKLIRQSSTEIGGDKPQTPFSATDSDDESSDLSSGVDVITLSTPKLKRKRDTFDDQSPRTPFAHDIAEFSESELEGALLDDTSSLERLYPDSRDWSLSGYFSLPENRASPLLALSQGDFIKVAQVLVDQVTQSSLCFSSDRWDEGSSTRETVRNMDLSKELQGVFGSCVTPTLDQFVKLQSKPSTSAPDELNSRDGSVMRLDPPHVRLQRGKSPLELLPSVLSFWETFGLEPVHGPKNVTAFCIVPQGPHVQEGAAAFLDRMGEVYSSCNLGSHKTGKAQDSSNQGFQALVHWEVSDKSAVERLLTTCEGLGQMLSKVPGHSQNLVIYVVDPFDHSCALVDICTAFLRLFEKYSEDPELPQGPQRNEVVLQVVPLSVIASTDSLAIPTQAEYIRLALEVYNRCPPSGSGSELAKPASAVVLEEPLAKQFNFDLKPDLTESLLFLQEGKCLHIAYSQSLDQRWITAAWTDNSGSLQMNMSYCLRQKDSTVIRPMAEVVKEIWETTHDIMKKTRTRWRLMLAKDGPFDNMEAREWALVASQSAKHLPKFYIVLISVDVRPTLKLHLPPSSSQVGNVSSQIATYSTPVSTPQPNTLSPDQFGNAATPGSGTMAANAPTPTDQSFELDTDAVLVDAADETWGIVLSHRLNNSNSLLEYRPALASGYLVKRRGTTDADGIVALGVNLVHASPGIEYEQLMKEILSTYRGLATLTRAKGMINPTQNVLPWHVATAVKGQQTLSYVL